MYYRHKINVQFNRKQYQTRFLTGNTGLKHCITLYYNFAFNALLLQYLDKKLE